MAVLCSMQSRGCAHQSHGLASNSLLEKQSSRVFAAGNTGQKFQDRGPVLVRYQTSETGALDPTALESDTVRAADTCDNHSVQAASHVLPSRHRDGSTTGSLEYPVRSTYVVLFIVVVHTSTLSVCYSSCQPTPSGLVQPGRWVLETSSSAGPGLKARPSGVSQKHPPSSQRTF
jgi:hypothetical protein